MLRIRMLCCLLVSATLYGCGTEPRTDVVKILDYGIYEGIATVREPAQAGQEQEVISVKVDSQPQATTTIPCQPNIYFGFRLDPKSLPAKYHLRLEYEHPPFTNKPDQTLEVDELDVSSSTDFDGEVIFCFFETAPHEMVPGTWRFRVLIDEKLAAEKSFDVVK